MWLVKFRGNAMQVNKGGGWLMKQLNVFLREIWASVVVAETNGELSFGEKPMYALL
jgi:hypothetical protein